MSVRQIVLDTETTGLDTAEGHRIIEIGCIELMNRRPSGNNFHQYLCPDREIDEGALAVHGISSEFLADKPRFKDVVHDFLGYVKGAELVIHNAAFDVGFLDYELQLSGNNFGCINDFCAVLDTLALARQKHPGQRNDLDALCRRYEIDNSQRSLHGALLDAEILADVYLAMSGGQTRLLLDEGEPNPETAATGATRERRAGMVLKVIRPSEDELDQHRAWLERLERESGKCLWHQLEDA